MADVRLANPGDVRAIEFMASKFVNSSGYREFINAAEAVERFRNLALAAMQDGLALVLVDDADLVLGMIGALPLVFPLSGDPYGEELVWWVEPEARGGSGAYRMLRRFEDWARQTGLRLAKMSGPADDPQFRAVMERLGYVAVETTFLKRL